MGPQIATGIALLVGLNGVGSAHYRDYRSWQCNGCEADATNMSEFLSHKAFGFDSRIMLTEEATKEKLITVFDSMATNLKEGDIFVFYFSGHGAQFPDRNHEENDSMDEAAILFDRPILDDEINILYQKIPKGVRLISIFDACHSGTSFKLNMSKGLVEAETKSAKPMSEPPDFDSPTPKAQCDMIHLAAADDRSLAWGTAKGGYLSRYLIKITNGGKFSGNYIQWFERLRDEMQRSGLYSFTHFESGENIFAFLKQRPFSI